MKVNRVRRSNGRYMTDIRNYFVDNPKRLPDNVSNAEIDLDPEKQLNRAPPARPQLLPRSPTPDRTVGV